MVSRIFILSCILWATIATGQDEKRPLVVGISYMDGHSSAVNVEDYFLDITRSKIKSSGYGLSVKCHVLTDYTFMESGLFKGIRGWNDHVHVKDWRQYSQYGKYNGGYEVRHKYYLIPLLGGVSFKGFYLSGGLGFSIFSSTTPKSNSSAFSGRYALKKNKLMLGFHAKAGYEFFFDNGLGLSINGYVNTIPYKQFTNHQDEFGDQYIPFYKANNATMYGAQFTLKYNITHKPSSKDGKVKRDITAFQGVSRNSFTFNLLGKAMVGMDLSRLLTPKVSGEIGVGVIYDYFNTDRVNIPVGVRIYPYPVKSGKLRLYTGFFANSMLDLPSTGSTYAGIQQHNTVYNVGAYIPIGVTFFSRNFFACSIEGAYWNQSADQFTTHLTGGLKLSARFD